MYNTRFSLPGQEGRRSAASWGVRTTTPSSSVRNARRTGASAATSRTAVEGTMPGVWASSPTDAMCDPSLRRGKNTPRDRYRAMPTMLHPIPIPVKRPGRLQFPFVGGRPTEEFAQPLGGVEPMLQDHGVFPAGLHSKANSSPRWNANLRVICPPCADKNLAPLSHPLKGWDKGAAGASPLSPLTRIERVCYTQDMAREYRRKTTSVSLINYHFVWRPKSCTEMF